MKILVICQYYYPEPFRIADICEDLVQAGHEVLVVTGTPNYPEGIIFPGYEHGQHRDEIRNGVRIHRCFTIGRKGGIIKRVLNYYSYAFSSCNYIKKLKEEFDVVLVYQLSPVMMAQAGIKYKLLRHKPLIIYSLDLWPESLISGGVHRGSLIYRLFHFVSKKIYSKANFILTSSRLFTQYFTKEFAYPADQIKYLPQYSESLFDPALCKKVPNDYIDLMFAGNIGKAQSIDTIIYAAQKTADILNLRWHIVGDGSEAEHCRNLVKKLNLNSVIFYGRKNISEMAKFYAQADAMIVSLQADPVISLTLPGKVQSYMAAGKPIIATADGETSTIIRDAKCGFCGAAESAEELAANVRKFIATKDSTLGVNAQNYYEQHFSKDKFMVRLQQFLNHGEII